MDQRIIAKAYAKSIYELATENNVDIVGELNQFNILVNKNNNFENLIFSDVFSAEEKTDVLKTVFSKLNSSSLVKNMLFFLIQEGRVGLFPLIYKDIVVLDDDKKGFLRGIIEGSDTQANEDFKNKIADYLKGKLNKNIELDYVQNSEISAGYRVTVEDLQLDASLENQLENFKNSVLNL